MNENHLQQIFANYIEKFEELNGPKHEEYFKWEIVENFKPLMDSVLNSTEQEGFIANLKEVKKKTYNFIDNYTQPLGGLISFSNYEWKTVQEMFQKLYEDDGGDLEIRQKKIEAFLEQSHKLKDKYAPKSYLYKDDFHSVTGYLFLYDPDHNYIYKATHAQAFADCVEFYDDFGTGDHVKLKNYYRMCDQLVKAIQENESLKATNKSRFTNGWGIDPDTLYQDDAKHVLAFDIIYCCSTYNLFQGITFKKVTTKERNIVREKTEKARVLLEELKQVQAEWEKIEQAINDIDTILKVGTAVKYLNKRSGTIIEKSENSIVVAFEDGTSWKSGKMESVLGGYISMESEEANIRLMMIREMMKGKSSIETRLSMAEREFAPYSEYI